MMYEVRVKRHFDAAHALRGYKGKCETTHGHRYEVVVCVESEALDEMGLAYDFTELKRVLDSVIERFDHTYLNELRPFDEKNPSSENIARVVYEELEGRIAGARLGSVEVWESPDAWVTYSV
ncbi:MAG: 6-carboxytetrahydropterin synthase QueD [Anaerolineae bacterium]|nr:6-carboxytetrahydropterin synthase QueD [Anaerolineae bacterium]